MSEDLHKDDEQFKKAYEGSEEKPSDDVWNKINAALDRQDAVYYRRKFVAWKYIACLLILLSGSTLAYYTYFYHPGETNGMTASDRQNVQGSSDTASQALSNTPDNHSNKNIATVPAQSFPDGKANFFPDTSIPVDETKDGISSQSANNKSQDATDDKPSHTILNNTLRIQTSGRKEANSAFNNGFANHQNHDSDSYQPERKTLMESLVIQKEEQSINPISGIDSINQNHERGIIKRNEDSASITKNNRVDSNALAQADASSGKKAGIKIKPRFSPYWTITPFASADVMGYRLDDDAQHRGNNEPDDKGDIQERESHEFSFTAGVMAALQFSKKIGFKTGLQYSNISIGIQPQTLYADRDNNQDINYKLITSSGYAYVDAKNGNTPNLGDSIITDGAEHNLQYLNVPLLLTYNLYSGKKLSVTAGAGLSAHLLLGSKVVTEIKKPTGGEQVIIHKLQGLRNQYFSFVADASLNWRINSRFSLSLLPSFKYAITPITKENIVDTYPFGVGIGAGVVYKL